MLDTLTRTPLVPWLCSRRKPNGYRCGRVVMELAEIDRGVIVKKCQCGAWLLWRDGRTRELTDEEVQAYRGREPAVSAR